MESVNAAYSCELWQWPYGRSATLHEEGSERLPFEATELVPE